MSKKDGNEPSLPAALAADLRALARKADELAAQVEGDGSGRDLHELARRLIDVAAARKKLEGPARKQK